MGHGSVPCRPLFLLANEHDLKSLSKLTKTHYVQVDTDSLGCAFLQANLIIIHENQQTKNKKITKPTHFTEFSFLKLSIFNYFKIHNIQAKIQNVTFSWICNSAIFCDLTHLVEYLFLLEVHDHLIFFFNFFFSVFTHLSSHVVFTFCANISTFLMVAYSLKIYCTLQNY